MIKFIPRLPDDPNTSYGVVMDNGVEFAELYQETDGFYVLESKGFGFLNSWVLRGISDKLDELNAEWQASINRYFKAQEEEGLNQFMQELDRL